MNIQRKYCVHHLKIEDWQSTSKALSMQYDLFIKVTKFRNISRDLQNHLKNDFGEESYHDTVMNTQ